ncbi:hypothetical protein [Clostridium estertheticum]|uniref:hypothetical protein n=1 Tax=Clostridium estertheticum TaxID=238834 RepID=UPI001C0B5825|nr:hypothetical protein [Clostridium estertheticum]MBU3072952.1 hypothetical protein [Clostridium estertheticum]MBU3163011.1 hypothetical protein [Clostridium estertheticum]MBU3172731.1 hypothetical protein [Clostridium estertheticum]
MDIKRGLFGATKEEKEAYIFTLENSKGMKAQVTNYGAILVSLFRAVYKKMRRFLYGTTVLPQKY